MNDLVIPLRYSEPANVNYFSVAYLSMYLTLKANNFVKVEILAMLEILLQGSIQKLEEGNVNKIREVSFRVSLKTCEGHVTQSFHQINIEHTVY